MFSNLKQFETKPNTFEGTFIRVQDRIMVWQNGVIHRGYVYLP